MNFWQNFLSAIAWDQQRLLDKLQWKVTRDLALRARDIASTDTTADA